MEKGEKLTGGPYWTQNWIEAMWRFTAERFVDFDTGTVDFEALGREEYEFRKALFFRNFKNSPRARDAFDAAEDDYCKKVANGQKGGRPRKDTTADGDTREGSQGTRTAASITRNEPLEHDPLEPSATISADGDTREDSMNISDVGNGGSLESSTSANHYGDAPRREAGEAATSRESGVYTPTTVSRNMRRVPQNEAPAHGFSGGRTAHGTMSRSPEAAAQSGKAYDQEPDRRISTDDALDLLRAGVMASSQAPTRKGSRARNSRRPKSREEFHAFVADNNLHENLAEEWFAMHEARGWVDKDGNSIKDWRGALYNYCTKTEQKRRTA